MTSLATELLAQLRERGGLLEGHFRLSSGRHSDRFIQKFRLLEDPALVTLAVTALHEQLGALSPTVVVSAAVGGIVLGFEMARQMGVRSIFVEKEAGIPALRRGFSVSAQDRVLVVEDVVTTGGSVREVLALMHERGASVEAIGVIVQRASIDFHIPTFALLDLPTESYDPQHCPQCAQGRPLEDPGSRRLADERG